MLRRKFLYVEGMAAARIFVMYFEPDGALRKLLYSGRLTIMGWSALVGLEKDMRQAYQDILECRIG